MLPDSLPTAAETSKPALCMFIYQLILPGRDMMQHDFFCPKLCDKAWLGVTRESQADMQHSACSAGAKAAQSVVSQKPESRAYRLQTNSM